MFNILLAVLKETFLAMVTKLAFRALAERFASRLVIYGLNKLKNYSTNEVVDETVTDIINQLKGKKLPVFDQEG